MNRTRKLRLGAVSYLNTKPLVYGLSRRLPHAEITFDFPSRLADRLARGEFDVALIPSLEYFRTPGARIVSDACIGCRGPVWSVKLLSRKPGPEIQTLALDEGSRTSAALVRILLHERFGIHPATNVLPIEAEADAVAGDAVLLIGDRAIHEPAGRWEFVWDLGEEWVRWSELSFVFAMWVARPDLAEEELLPLAEALNASREEGLANLELIARQEAAAIRLTPEACLSYLRDNLYFRLGPREQAGLELYRSRADALGLIAPRGESLVTISCSGATGFASA